MTGSQEVLKKIRKNSLALIITGGICTAVSLFLAVSGITSIEPDAMGMTITGVILMFISVTLLYFGARDYRDPSKSSAYKKNPDILAMADELAGDIRYEDKFVYMSGRIIANKRNVTQMAYLDEVYCIYIYKYSVNFIPATKDLLLQTARGEIHLSVFWQKKAAIDRLARMILNAAPNARAGYTPDNMKYVAYMKNEWKKRRLGGYTEE